MSRSGNVSIPTSGVLLGPTPEASDSNLDERQTQRPRNGSTATPATPERESSPVHSGVSWPSLTTSYRPSESRAASRERFAASASPLPRPASPTVALPESPEPVLVAAVNAPSHTAASAAPPPHTAAPAAAAPPSSERLDTLAEMAMAGLQCRYSYEYKLRDATRLYVCPRCDTYTNSEPKLVQAHLETLHGKENAQLQFVSDTVDGKDVYLCPFERCSFSAVIATGGYNDVVGHVLAHKSKRWCWHCHKASADLAGVNSHGLRCPHTKCTTTQCHASTRN